MTTRASDAPDSRIEVTDARGFGRVAVLYGGMSSERAVSLDTGSAVLAALLSRGIDAAGWDPAERSFCDFPGAGFDRAWIALHGPGGEDGALQGALEWLGLPYTGSGVMASALAMDKVRSKHLFRAAGLPTPEYRVISSPADARPAIEALGLPLIVKPAGQGSSVGMSKVTVAADLNTAIEAASRFGGPVLAERCIVGGEFTVGVLQERALPTIRIESPADARPALEALGLPLIVKPAGQGSSVGMSKVTVAAELGAAIDAASGFGGPVLAERCIVGGEFTVGVLQGRALPTIRIETPRVFYDYEAKYHSDETRYHCPGTASADAERRYAELALAAFAELGCEGWGRVDFMTGNDGIPQILEVNTVPGMTSHSLVPMAARAAGLDFAELCWRILETSMAEETGAALPDRREAANGA
jgi:D-alanine-D-alanine ligase-like ATP-grasp enzyme